MNNNEVRIAFVGLGARGLTALRLMLPVNGAQVTALCDITADGVNAALELISSISNREQSRQPSPLSFVGQDAFAEVCRLDNVDLIYVCSNWQSHTRIALQAMSCGKHVAIEVPAALTLDDIQQLITMSQRSGCHCFMLENCCYDPAIEAAIRDVRRGDIGEPVHAEGSYYHHLADRWTRWRLDINRHQRGDLYPTHEMAHLCQALGIGIDDELHTLVAMDSAPMSGAATYKQLTGSDVADFQNGDHTTTLIRTRRGRTILLKHDVLTEQPYERMFRIIGTKGIREVTDRGNTSHETLTLRMNERLIGHLINHEPLDWDVYDMARWCAVIPLSRLSIEQGFMPVPFPEF